MKILVVRNDKLGDFVLSLPCYSLLKKSIPNVHLTALIPKYTQDVANEFSDINDVLIDDGSTLELAKEIKKQNFDVVIVLFSTTRIAIATLLAGIKTRIAPKTKLAQIFYKNPLLQRRSQSLKPEYQYNLDLIYHFLQNRDIELKAPFWQLKKQKTIIKDNTIIIHPGSGGSANNLNIWQYAQLVNGLIKHNKSLFFAITAGKGEEENANKLLNSINTNNKIIVKNLTLLELLHNINSCDIFIGGSTGPLHLAGILNKKTIAFYPNLQSSTALRWQTLNEKDKRLSFSPPKNIVEDMSKVDIKSVINKVCEIL